MFAAHLFCLQRSFFVCSASFLFAEIVFCLQRTFFVCSDHFLFAAIVFCLQRIFFVCSDRFLFAACPLCICVHDFQAINGTVESALFMQLSNLIKSLPIRWPTRDMLQTKNDRCKQKRCAANKKPSLQTKKPSLQTKIIAANKKPSPQTKNHRCKQKTIAANKKKDALQTKNAVGIWSVTGPGFQNTKWPAVRYFQ